MNFMFRLISTSIIIALLGSCAHSPLVISRMSTEKLEGEPSDALCNSFEFFRRPPGRFYDYYDFNLSQKIKAELQSRGEITEDEWGLIETRSLTEGMSELAVICSWGNPIDFNRSVGDWGTLDKYMYSPLCHNCTPRHVFVENGVVTDWLE